MEEFNVRSMNFPHLVNCLQGAGSCGTNMDLGALHMVESIFMEECMCAGVRVGWRSMEVIRTSATLSKIVPCYKIIS